MNNQPPNNPTPVPPNQPTPSHPPPPPTIIPITPKQAFWIGGLGGIAPLAARGVGHLIGSGGDLTWFKPASLVSYGLALILLFGLGGLISLFTDDAAARTFRSAFALGLSLPSLFQLGGLQAPKKTADISTPLHFALISSAFAQEPSAAPTSGLPGTTTNETTSSARKLEVSTPNTPISKDVNATFLDKSGNQISSTVIQPGFAAVNVPAQAAAVQFQKDGAASESHPLSNNSVQTADVKIEQKPVSAFVQAIGLSREAKPSIEVTKINDAPKLPPLTYGWCNLGERGADGWRTRNVDFAGQDVPQIGSIVTANTPLTLWPDTTRSAVTGVANVGQRLRIEEIKNQGDVYWAAVTVVE